MGTWDDPLGKVKRRIDELRRRNLNRSRQPLPPNVVTFAPRSSGPAAAFENRRPAAGVFITDRSGACVFANQECLKFLGCSLAQALGAGLLKCVTGQHRREFVREWKRNLRLHQPFSMRATVRRADTRHTITLLVCVMPILTEDGQVVGYSGLCSPDDGVLGELPPRELSRVVKSAI